MDILALYPTATRSQFPERAGSRYVAQRTPVLGAITGSVLTVSARVRAATAQVLLAVLPRR